MGVVELLTLCSVVSRCHELPISKDLACERVGSRPLGDCSYCCKVEDKRDIRFMLYTGDNQDTADQLYVGDNGVLAASHFDVKLPTVFYVHGFTEIYKGLSGQTIKKAYMKRGGWNVILVDWHGLSAGPTYMSAANNVKIVGAYVAKFVKFLEQNDVPITAVHLIGFSLGGEVVGFAGRKLNGRLNRVTALDPALPAFRLTEHLSAADAIFVDVMHTDAGRFGFETTLGHVDFYPDGGKFHEGCPMWILNVPCNHLRAWQYYAESVNNECGFKANKCADNIELAAEKCDGEVGYMGFAAQNFTSTRGMYFLKTNGESPYAKNKDGCPK